jgi:hypothetical protein
MYLLGPQWFAGTAQALYFNISFVIWLAAELLIKTTTKHN